MAPYFGLKGTWLTFWVAVACATDMALFGYDQGVFGGVVVTGNYLDVMGLRNNSGLLGTVTGMHIGWVLFSELKINIRSSTL